MLLGFHSNPSRASLMADIHHKKLIDLVRDTEARLLFFTSICVTCVGIRTRALFLCLSFSSSSSSFFSSSSSSSFFFLFPPTPVQVPTEVSALFLDLEATFQPLGLMARAVPRLAYCAATGEDKKTKDGASSSSELTSQGLALYVPPLTKLVVLRLLKQLAVVRKK
jgi:hypothetical protein